MNESLYITVIAYKFLCISLALYWLAMILIKLPILRKRIKSNLAEDLKKGYFEKIQINWVTAILSAILCLLAIIL